MSGWSIDLGKYATDTVEKTNQVCRKVALSVFRRVVMRTPVDTGRARANWIPTVGSPSSEITEATDKSGAGAMGKATGQASRWDPSKGQSIFLTNNLPYIEVLEKGRVGNKGSLQAPQGMVSITVAEFGGIVSEEAAT
jgi:hypothetical protein